MGLVDRMKDEMKIRKINFKSGTHGFAFEIGKLGIFIGNNGFAIDYVGGFHYEYYAGVKI